MQVKINDETIDLKFNFRAEIIYEQAQGETFQGKGTGDWLIYFFCQIIANTNDGFISFDDYLQWVSDLQNTVSFYEFIEYYTEYQKNILDLRAMKKKEATKKQKAVKKKK